MQETLSEKTYRALRHKLLTGELQAGAQLVNRALAQSMEVSLAPVREAINRLATEGLIDHIPGAGAFVRKPTVQDLSELYILREAVESCAAAEAARNITPTQLESLDRLRNDLEAILKSIRSRKSQMASDEMLDRWLDCEEQFHLIVVAAASNRLLAKVIEDYTALGQILGVQRHRAAILTLSVAEETCRDHTAIVTALRDHNADAARVIMSEHIRKGCHTVLEYLRAEQQKTKRNKSSRSPS